MADIKIYDLTPAGTELFEDQTMMSELDNAELESLSGGFSVFIIVVFF